MLDAMGGRLPFVSLNTNGGKLPFAAAPTKACNADNATVRCTSIACDFSTAAYGREARNRKFAVSEISNSGFCSALQCSAPNPAQDNIAVSAAIVSTLHLIYGAF